MALLPLSPRLDHYRGSNDKLTRRAAEHYAVAHRVVDHLNALIVNDPREMQQYNFAFVASDLGLTFEQVRSAVNAGGYNGITIHVRGEDRQALVRYRR